MSATTPAVTATAAATGATGASANPAPDATAHPTASRAVDHALLKRVMSTFCTGVAVVTATSADGAPVGMAVQSFASLSLDPPLICFAPARTSTSWPRIREAGRFAVTILAEDQTELSRAFATSGGDKFADVRWHPCPNGAPAPDGALATIECTLDSEVPGGDHTIAVARVTGLHHHREAGPLLYFRRAYGGYTAGPAGDARAA